MENKAMLKKPVRTKKFDVVFPANVELNYIEDEYGILVEHPSLRGVYTRPNKKNIVTLKPVKP